MKNITVYGATGMVGSAIAAEAVRRDLEVIGMTRKTPEEVASPIAGVTYATGELSATADVVARAASADALVVSVPGPRDGSSVQPIIDSHAALIAALDEAGVTTRVFIVGGAGATLTAEGVMLKDTPEFPAMYKAEATSFAEVLDLWRAAPSSLDWVMLAPAPMIGPGEPSASYVLGEDHPAGDAVTTGTFAIATLDELQNPAHRRTRFTVADA